MNLSVFGVINSSEHHLEYFLFILVFQFVLITADKDYSKSLET